MPVMRSFVNLFDIKQAVGQQSVISDATAHKSLHCKSYEILNTPEPLHEDFLI